ncbi:hypothetical protein [Actinomadura sp. 3N407]|uniref:hypothetical protein n=1 Tax=Actinomadura sp. 3N407 TaxID=3457423 RepID=UPI003FCEB3D7
MRNSDTKISPIDLSQVSTSQLHRLPSSALRTALAEMLDPARPGGHRPAGFGQLYPSSPDSSPARP